MDSFGSFFIGVLEISRGFMWGFFFSLPVGTILVFNVFFFFFSNSLSQEILKEVEFILLLCPIS